MHTANFNSIDKLLMNWRLGKVKRYISSGDIILDIGCGTQAKLLHFFSPIIKSGVGIDYDLNKKIISGNITLLPLTFTGKLPFKDETFTKVTMLAVLEHIKTDIVIADIKEIRRVLRKNGLLIMTTPRPNSQPLLEAFANLGIISKGEIFDHKKYYDKKDILEVCEKTGFRLLQYRTFQLGLNSLIILIK